LTNIFDGTSPEHADEDKETKVDQPQQRDDDENGDDGNNEKKKAGSPALSRKHKKKSETKNEDQLSGKKIYKKHASLPYPFDIKTTKELSDQSEDQRKLAVRNNMEQAEVPKSQKDSDVPEVKVQPAQSSPNTRRIKESKKDELLAGMPLGHFSIVQAQENLKKVEEDVHNSLQADVEKRKREKPKRNEEIASTERKKGSKKKSTTGDVKENKQKEEAFSKALSDLRTTLGDANMSIMVSRKSSGFNQLIEDSNTIINVVLKEVLALHIMTEKTNASLLAQNVDLFMEVTLFFYNFIIILFSECNSFILNMIE